MARRTRPGRGATSLPAPCILSTSIGAIRVERNAGTVPKMLAVTNATAAVNARTRQSNERSSVMLVGPASTTEPRAPGCPTER